MQRVYPSIVMNKIYLTKMLRTDAWWKLRTLELALFGQVYLADSLQLGVPTDIETYHFAFLTWCACSRLLLIRIVVLFFSFRLRHIPGLLHYVPHCGLLWKS